MADFSFRAEGKKVRSRAELKLQLELWLEPARLGLITNRNPLFSYIAERKVLLVTGSDSDEYQSPQSQTEIVDSFGQPKQCTSIQKYPTTDWREVKRLKEAMGGVLQGIFVMAELKK